MAATTQSSPFLKQLASSNKKTRDAALDSLRAYLSGRTNFDELELLKLWKGLFYCMWMQDRTLPQQRLATDLAGLVDILPPETALPFIDAFWKTIAREWNGIDVLRMNKFLLLIRRYLNRSFKFLSRNDWKDTAAIDKYMEILSATPLNPKEPKIPNGLRYHVIDIYVDELDKVDERREGTMPLETLLGPLRRLLKESPTKPVRERCKEALADERLEDWKGSGESKEDEDEEEKTTGEGSKSKGADAEEDEDEEWGGLDD